MRQFSGTGQTYYSGIGIDNALMAANDLAAKGALAVTYTDEAAAGDSEWFEDEEVSRDLGQSYYEVCKETGMALVGGESPSLKYLVKALPPVRSAPVLSGCAVGVISPIENLITGTKLGPGSVILAVKSSGLHANGIGLVIGTAFSKFGEDGLLAKMPNGKTLGEEALIPTRSYVNLVEALQENSVPIHAFLPGTGDGVAKLAFDKRPLTYYVHTWWPEYPLIFQFMLQAAGIPLIECLKTFNMGSGYYVFVARKYVQRTIDVGIRAGYELLEVGVVEDGQRHTVFGPASHLILPPPGE